MFDKPLGAELIGLTRFSRKYLPVSLKPPLYLKKKKFEKFIFMIVQEKSVERENVLKGTPPFSFTSAPDSFKRLSQKSLCLNRERKKHTKSHYTSHTVLDVGVTQWGVCGKKGRKSFLVKKKL